MYFDEIMMRHISSVDMCRITRMPMPRLNVSLFSARMFTISPAKGYTRGVLYYPIHATHDIHRVYAVYIMPLVIININYYEGAKPTNFLLKCYFIGSNNR